MSPKPDAEDDTQVDITRSPVPVRPAFALRSFGLSDPGMVRKTNEDHFVIAELTRSLLIQQTNLPQEKTNFSGHRGFIFLVADGMGGHKAGEVASQISVRTIEDYLLNTLKRFSNLQAGEEQTALKDLQAALMQADARIFQETARHPEWRGMGTTLTLGFAVNWRLFVAHAGDSRCYWLSRGKFVQVTRDHTLIAEMVRKGMLTPESGAQHPYRHVVTNILGGSEVGVRVDLYSLDVHPGDVFLFCSDGLTEMVPEPVIAEILQGETEPDRACQRLILEANQRGGKDNVTVIVARVE